MADDETTENDKSEPSGGKLPVILGALTIVLNIVILLYLILFPAGGGDQENIIEITRNVQEMNNDMLPSMEEKISALTSLLPSEGEQPAVTAPSKGGAELSELTIMLTDTQLIMRQLAENLSSDTATIKKSIGDTSQAGKQLRNLRQDLKRIEKKLNQLLGERPDSKKKKLGALSPSIFDYQDQGVTYP